MNDLETFLSKIEYQSNGCWKWTGSFLASGYGQISYQGKNWRAHRLAYHLLREQLPADDTSYICHACNNPWCVNPEHLVRGNAYINNMHARISGRIPTHDQRRGRSKTSGRDLPKGITYDAVRQDYKCSIRVGEKRIQARKKTLAEALIWRCEMEDKYW